MRSPKKSKNAKLICLQVHQRATHSTPCPVFLSNLPYICSYPPLFYCTECSHDHHRTGMGQCWTTGMYQFTEYVPIGYRYSINLLTTIRKYISLTTWWFILFLWLYQRLYTRRNIKRSLGHDMGNVQTTSSWCGNTRYLCHIIPLILFWPSIPSR